MSKKIKEEVAPKTIKIKDRITVRQSMEIDKLFKNNETYGLIQMVKIIAEFEDGSELDPLEMTEEEIMDVVALYIAKKNSTMKAFINKVQA